MLCVPEGLEGGDTEAPLGQPMELTAEESAILRGEQGEALRKTMDSVVKYGAAFEAQRLVRIAGAPHLVTSFGAGTMQPYFAMLDELISAGLHSEKPFTVNPRPVDRRNVRYSVPDRLVLRLLFGRQEAYESQLAKLGLRDGDAFSCTCYLPEVGNTPQRDQVLAWSESSAVVFANSVLGARTNRNAAGIDLLCNLLGKAPLFGLLTDEGRRASWLVEVRSSELPNAQLLGSAIGQRVIEDVPYIAGLDRFLGPAGDERTLSYLKDMGAAAASNGAVGLYHVENITPEAVALGRGLLTEGHGRYEVSDAELERVMRGYPVLWKRDDARPRLCFIGCPHLSLQQVAGWTERILSALRGAGRAKPRLDTYLCAAPQVLQAFRRSSSLHEAAAHAGLRYTSLCPLMFMTNPLARRKAVVTDSNKLRTYSTARFFLDDDVVDILVEGCAPASG
jgi:predicted aconitase